MSDRSRKESLHQVCFTAVMFRFLRQPCFSDFLHQEDISAKIPKFAI